MTKYDRVQLNPLGSYAPRFSYDRYRSIEFTEVDGEVEALYVHEDTGLVVADIPRFESWLCDVAKIEWDED